MDIKYQETNFTERKGINPIIYIINLDRAVERKKSIEQELLKTNIPFQFVSAIDKTTVDTLKHKVYNRYKRALIPAEVACFLSHIKVKELFLKSTHDFAIILEDDIQLSENFDEYVKKAMKQHLSLPKKHQWDVLKLSSHGRRKILEIKEIDTNYSLYGGSVAITTMAAIWTRKGAEFFLAKAIKNGYRIINMPIDCALQEHWRYNLKIYNIVPYLVEAKKFGSQIRPKEGFESSFFKTVSYEIGNWLPRVYFYLKTWLFR